MEFNATESLAQKEEEGLIDIEEAPIKTYYSDEEIWHVITTETNQGPIPWPVVMQCLYEWIVIDKMEKDKRPEFVYDCC